MNSMVEPAAYEDRDSADEALRLLGALLSRAGRLLETPDYDATERAREVVALNEALEDWLRTMPSDSRKLERGAVQESVTVLPTEMEDLAAHLAKLVVTMVKGTPELRSDYDTFEDALRRTSGLWKQGDGLDYQQRLREQWERST